MPTSAASRIDGRFRFSRQAKRTSTAGSPTLRDTDSVADARRKRGHKTRRRMVFGSLQSDDQTIIALIYGVIGDSSEGAEVDFP